MSAQQPLLGPGRAAEARSAFADGDAAASKTAHDKYLERKVPTHDEPTLPEGRLVKPLVFGGLDGTSTVFAVLAGGVGVQLEATSLVAIGLANVLAGAFSMAVGEYLSAVGEQQVAERELARERWEVHNYPEGERQEMVEIYEEKGMSHEDAVLVANTLSKYEDFWCEHMLLTEIGMLPPDDANPLSAAAVMFCAFFCFGSLPLVVFYLAHSYLEGDSIETYFFVSAFFTMISLFVLGAIKAKMADQSVCKGGTLMALQGTIAGALAYAAGAYFAQ